MRLLKPKLEAGPAKVPLLTRVGITGRRRTIFFIAGPILIVALLAIGSYEIYHTYIYKNPNVKPPKVENVATVKQHVRYTNANLDKALAKGDLQNYQLGKLEAANGYITVNDFASANAELQDVKANIPENKLLIYYWQLKLQIDKHNNDQAAQTADQQKIDELNKVINSGPPDTAQHQSDEEN